MKELKCPNCGAPINRATMRCDYCGSVFERDHNFYERIIQVENPKIIPVKTIARVDKRVAMMDGYEEYLVKEMAYTLAEKMAEFMDVTLQDDPMRDEVVACARVRVVPPNVKIW